MPTRTYVRASTFTCDPNHLAENIRVDRGWGARPKVAINILDVTVTHVNLTDASNDAAITAVIAAYVWQSDFEHQEFLEVRGHDECMVPPSGTRRIFTDSVTGKLSVRTSAGSTVSLEEQGGAATNHTTLTGLTGEAGHTGLQTRSEKGAVNGYAALDATGKIPDSQLADAITRDAELATASATVAALDGTGNAGVATTYSRGDHKHGGQAFPVGSVFIAVVATNPATLLGYGTWAAFAAGRVLVGIDSLDTDFDVVEETGGAKTHTLTTAEMPAHTHVEARFPTATGTSSGFTPDTSMSGTPVAVTQTTQSAGGGGPHNNLQPFVVVYFWKRTA